MKLKIAVCDDEASSRQNALKLLNNYLILSEDDIQISSFTSGEELILSCKSGNFFDIIFLDIELDNGLSGIDTGIALRKIYNHPFYLIYLTNYPQYMHDSFQAHAYMYLMKPLSMDVLKTTIHEIVVEIKKHTCVSLVVTYQDTEMFLNLDDIIYIETDNSPLSKGNILIHTKNEDLKISGTMKFYEEKLINSNFFSPSRSYLVNLKYIATSTSSEIVLLSGQRIPFSRRKRLEFQKKFTSYIMTIQW